MSENDEMGLTDPFEVLAEFLHEGGGAPLNADDAAFAILNALAAAGFEVVQERRRGKRREATGPASREFRAASKAVRYGGRSFQTPQEQGLMVAQALLAVAVEVHELGAGRSSE